MSIIKPNYVFVLDTNQKPLIPCKPSVARKLLNAGKAKVFRLYPFTIILNKEVADTPEPYVLKRVLSQAKRPLKDAAAVNSTMGFKYSRRLKPLPRFPLHSLIDGVPSVGGVLMSECPCCYEKLLRHICRGGLYWFCPNCRQEMPVLGKFAEIKPARANYGASSHQG